MRLRSVIIFALAVVFGGIAVVAARAWLDSQRDLLASQAQTSAPPAETIVVAAVPLRFGDRLQSENLKEIAWPSGQLPTGAFRTHEDMLADGERFALSAIEAGEPVLSWRITGPGQRATLSATLAEGMKAVTIRVNDVLGVAGFVLPGDRVDILLTRNARASNGDETRTFVDVLLQGVRVLAIDQTADDRRDKPTVVKAVTFEVSTEEAQKLTLASTVGQLSLALRGAAAAGAEDTRRVSLGDLDGGGVAAALAANRDDERIAELERTVERLQTEPAGPPPAPAAALALGEPRPAARADVTVGVWRNLKRQEYRIESFN